MELVNCVRCGKVIVQKTIEEKKICKNCQTDDAAQFKQVYNFLHGNPKARLGEISQGTGLSERAILDFLRQGRLSVRVSKSSVCESCGTAIAKGRFCQKCSKIEKLQSSLDSNGKGGRSAKRNNTGKPTKTNTIFREKKRGE